VLGYLRGGYRCQGNQPEAAHSTTNRRMCIVSRFSARQVRRWNWATRRTGRDIGSMLKDPEAKVRRAASMSLLTISPKDPKVAKMMQIR
jgi:hypothetical protein